MMAAASITAIWMMSGFIILAFLGVVAACKLYESWQLKRMRDLACSKCRKHFQVPNYSAVKRWMARDATINSGFYLRCENCGIEFRFGDNFECLSQAA